MKFLVESELICLHHSFLRFSQLSKRLDILIPNKVENCKSEFR